MVSMGDEDFGFGGKAVAWKHADQVIAGEDGNARRVHQVDRNERRRRRKWDCFKASAAEMVNVVRWLVVVDEGGRPSVVGIRDAEEKFAKGGLGRLSGQDGVRCRRWRKGHCEF